MQLWGLDRLAVATYVMEQHGYIVIIKIIASYFSSEQALSARFAFTEAFMMTFRRSLAASSSLELLQFTIASPIFCVKCIFVLSVSSLALTGQRTVNI